MATRARLPATPRDNPPRARVARFSVRGAGPSRGSRFHSRANLTTEEPAGFRAESHVERTARISAGQPTGLWSRLAWYYLRARPSRRTTMTHLMTKAAIETAREMSNARVRFQPHGDGDHTVRFEFDRHGGWPATKLIHDNRMYLGSPGELFKIVRDRHNNGDRVA